MQATERILLPWVAFLLRKGLRYTSVIPLLKNVFLQAAADELAKTAQPITASALSILSGVHRKDVRQWLERGELGQREHAPDVANQVWTLWQQDKTWAQCLPEHGMSGSFAALVRCVSKDVHPHTVVLELERLGLLQREKESGRICRMGDAYIPPADSIEALTMLVDSVQDHVLAGTHNLDAAKEHAMLEQSVFAEPLSPSSVQELEVLVRKEWQRMQAKLLIEARRLWLRDQQQQTTASQAERVDINNRFRVGVFTYRAKIETEKSSTDKLDNGT